MTKQKQKKSPKRGENWRRNLVVGKLLYQSNGPTRMRLRRVETGEAQAVVAKKLGLSSAAYGDIERGVTPVKEARAAEIAKLLRVSGESLFAPHPKMRDKFLATRKV